MYMFFVPWININHSYQSSISEPFEEMIDMDVY